MNRRVVFRWTIPVWLCFCAAMGAAQSTSQVIQGEEIENFLAQAKITRQQSISVGVTLPRKLSLELDGKMQFAAFKTIDEGPVPTKQLDGGVELQFQDSWRTEVAAYEFGQADRSRHGSCDHRAACRWETWILTILGHC